MLEDLLDRFASLPSAYRTGLLALGVVAFWLLEDAAPLFPHDRRRWRHAGVNLTLTALQLIVGFGFATLLVRAADLVTTERIGLLYLFTLPLWAHTLLALLLLDLVGAYLSHRVEHHVSWLWRFHIIHHSDTAVDVTTGLRHHPVETVLRSVFTTLGVLVVGAPIGMVFLYQTLSIFFAHLSHANVRSPARIDRWLAWIFVTPNFHKVHHHRARPLTDSNYGNIFSIWDRMLGTARDEELASLRYGIDSLPDAKGPTRVGGLLLLPFRKQDASLRDEGSQVSRAPEN